LDVNKIKPGFFWNPKGITILQEEFKDIDTLEKFDGLLKRQWEKFIEEEAQKNSEERKKKTIDQSIEQTVLDSKIGKLSAIILEKQRRKKQVREEKKEAERQEKIEKANKIPKEERLQRLSALKTDWDLAYEIDQAIREGKKVKIEKGKKGKTLDGKKDKNELQEKKDELSGNIIKIITEATGIDPRVEALRESGYDPKAKIKDENKRELFRRALTRIIAEKFSEQMAALSPNKKKKVKL